MLMKELNYKKNKQLTGNDLLLAFLRVAYG